VAILVTTQATEARHHILIGIRKHVILGLVDRQDAKGRAIRLEDID